MTWEDIIEQVNIVDYIQQYTDLKEENGELWGVCPLHNENTPSFCVNEDKQTFYCFGCNSGGTLINFIMEYEKCTCAMAIEKIKSFYNINDEEYKSVPMIIKILRRFKKFKPENKTILREEISNQISKRFTSSDIKEWITEGISQKVMNLFNVKYDKTENAIAFEVRDNCGKLIAFKERTLYPDFKERNIPKYTFTNPIGTNDFLWAFYLNKESCFERKEIILVEGEKSVMKLMTWGINNCVAIGTSHINDEQLAFLIGLGLNVVVAIDKDKHKTMFKDEKWKKLRRYCKVYMLYDGEKLLEEKDAPVDKGLEIWKKLYDKKRILS
jgi:DNA primase